MKYFDLVKSLSDDYPGISFNVNCYDALWEMKFGMLPLQVH